jgi:AmmeMemoRadiSam system protein A
MISNPLNASEKEYLLKLARQSIEMAVSRRGLPEILPEELTPNLKAEGASFVTLTEYGELRGCIGALSAYQSLAEDVREHAVAAALDDYRFRPVQAQEVPFLKIEVSRLTPPEPLNYQSPEELPALLHPGVDGVILRDGAMRATFLPQVWEKLPEPEDFLAHLCQKMGAAPNHWRKKVLQVQIYHVEEWSEK